MKLNDVLRDPLVLRIQDVDRAVEQSIASEIQRICGRPIPVKRMSEEDNPSEKGALFIASEGSLFPQVLKSAGVQPSEKEWVLFFVDRGLGCWLLSSKPYFLYAAFRYVLDFLQGEDMQPGYIWFREMSFSREKATFDLFLTQYARMIRNFNRENYIAEYARCGFTHIEVNGLAALFPWETGVEGEFYPDFYTYCPALDQFVSSRLNRGLYPEEYLQVNRSRLKENAELALKYGLIPDKVPFPVNQEVFRRFQFDGDLDIDEVVAEIACRYSGSERRADLVGAWRLVDKAVRSFPPLSIYSHYGAVWQRLLVRPLVPDIDRIPERNRDYYEKFMCASVHNPNRVDLAKDVLFELVSIDYAKASCEKIDANVLPVLKRVLDKLSTVLREQDLKEQKNRLNIFLDLYDRCRALQCLFLTLRNTAAWIYAVHTFLDTENPDTQASCRMILDELIESEIRNAQDCLDLWENSPVEWMIVSGQGETPFIYGMNFGLLLKKKIVLMRRHKNDNPSIDPDYMFRVENNPYEVRRDR